MARYGESLYGASFFGDISPNLYHSESFTAVESGFGDAVLTWSSPGGDWSTLRLVRNKNGYPADEINGTIVYETPSGVDSGRVVDRGLLTDRWTYYSLFAYNAPNDLWFRSGNVRLYVPANFGGERRMYDLLPSFYKQAPYNLALAVDPVTLRRKASNPLAAFMAVFGYQYDLITNLMSSALDFNDAGAVCYDLIPAALKQFNLPAEPEIGPEQYRRLLRNALFLYQTKGSRTGVHGLVAALTGWDCYVRPGTNLIWDAEHSDFIGGIGYWAAGRTGCDVVWKPEDSTPSAMRIVAATNGACSTSFVTDDNVEHLGILVLPESQYNISLVLQAGDTLPSSAQVVADWYDSDNNLISSSYSTATRTRTSDVRLSAVVTAPAGVVRGGVSVLMTGVTTGSWWVVKHVQLNRNPAMQVSEPGRDVHVILRSQRINIIHNGSFERDLDGWQTHGNIAIEQDLDHTIFGAASMKITYTGTTAGYETVDNPDYVYCSFDTTPGTRYVLQWEIGGDSLNNPAATALGALVAVGNTATEALPAVSDTGITTVTASATNYFNPHADSFARGAVPFVAEQEHTIISVHVANATNGDSVYLDAVLVEEQAEGTFDQVFYAPPGDYTVVRSYFDGTTSSLTDDYLWEGDPFASRSHFYYRRTIHENRLRALLPDFLPLGATFTLLWAQPDEEYYAFDDVILVEGTPVVPTTVVSKSLTVRWGDETLVSKLLQGVWTVVGRGPVPGALASVTSSAPAGTVTTV